MKLLRASGRPINPKHIIEMKAKLDDSMDKLEEDFGKCSIDNAKEYQSKLETIHADLTDLYPTIINIKYPKTIKEMNELLELYGCVAFCFERDKNDKNVAVMYILDN